MKGKFHPRYASSPDAFAKRGDPWATNKEGEKNYGRVLETEDADYDAQQQRLSSNYYKNKAKVQAKDKAAAMFKPKGQGKHAAKVKAETKAKRNDSHTRLYKAMWAAKYKRKVIVVD